ncbi:hypothetical protein HI914_01880, partial [Erysiphe necator]
NKCPQQALDAIRNTVNTEEIILGAIKQPKLQFNKNFDLIAGKTWNTDSHDIVNQARDALLLSLLN